jgi:DNA-binding phage protein
MALTRTIRKTVKARIQADDGFRYALFSHAVEVMLADDMATAKSVLKDYIDATIGFADLATESGLTVRHLKRMFQPSGNPRAGEMFRVIGILQRHQGIQLEVSTAA